MYRMKNVNAMLCYHAAYAIFPSIPMNCRRKKLKKTKIPIKPITVNFRTVGAIQYNIQYFNRPDFKTVNQRYF